ncbi:MAG: cytochrome c maturation protein CcmE [Geminicoccaceae bacterium]|nr:MAG: cytochrome c maturation protein CcmE [Geminicoccaceae bacterium]
MRTRKAQRLVLVVGALGLLGAATGLVLASLGQNVAFFSSPTAILTGETKPGTRLRLGGIVLEGTVVHQDVQVRFAITDYAHDIPVLYTGILPDLFREGQGVVAIGQVDADGIFQADEILARHDEGYMPPEVSQALKDAEHWLPEL